MKSEKVLFTFHFSLNHREYLPPPTNIDSFTYKR